MKESSTQKKPLPVALRRRILTIDKQTQDLLDREKKENNEQLLFRQSKRIWENLHSNGRQMLREFVCKRNPSTHAYFEEYLCIDEIKNFLKTNITPSSFSKTALPE
jgi:hypothetical protein